MWSHLKPARLVLVLAATASLVVAGCGSDDKSASSGSDSASSSSGKAGGLTLEHRWASWRREPFTNVSRQHVSVYAKT